MERGPTLQVSLNINLPKDHRATKLKLRIVSANTSHKLPHLASGPSIMSVVQCVLSEIVFVQVD